MIFPYVEKDPTKFCTYEEFENGVATLREFCLLRAESISGQLDGTIGSTSDTQNSESLIDADDLQISDMGSMNNTMSDNKDKENGNMSKPQSEKHRRKLRSRTDRTLKNQPPTAMPTAKKNRNRMSRAAYPLRHI